MLSQADQNLYQQNTDLEILELCIPHLENKSFLDIGAEKGSFTEFLNARGLQGTFFEPLPAFAPELSLIATRTGCRFLPFAIDSVDRTADFYTATDHDDNPVEYFSSLHPLQQDHRIVHKKATTVTCRSLDSLLQEGTIKKQFGIIKIDTEGNDLHVLKGMHQVTADIIMCEISCQVSMPVGKMAIPTTF